MTTFGQAEFEALGLLEKKHTTTVRVTKTIANHPDMLTDKELEVSYTSNNRYSYVRLIFVFGLTLHCKKPFASYQNI